MDIEEIKNTIIQGEALEVLKSLPDESVNCVITSPPYWSLRDYGTANWEGGDKKCEHKVQNNIKDFGGDWDRPSRKEFNKIGTLLKCQVCKKEFNGKIGNKFCSTKCLNTLSNEERTKATSEIVNICFNCGAKRIDKQLGLEPTFQEYVTKLCDIFDEVKRVLKKTGTCWVNLGDTYGGSNCGYGQTKESSGFQNVVRQKYYATSKNRPLSAKVMPKSLIMIPFRFAIEMANRGWILRNEIIWFKPNCMPSSVKDRFTVNFEKIFFFVKSKKYWFEPQYEQLDSKPHNPGNKNRIPMTHHFDEPDRIWGSELGRNKRCVWKITTQPFPFDYCPKCDIIVTSKDLADGMKHKICGAEVIGHFATFPTKLIKPMIMAGCPKEICKKCGVAREKIIKHTGEYEICGGKDSITGKEIQKVSPTSTLLTGKRKIMKEIGYTDCGCNAGWDKGIVLDPFMGSGTTGLAALKLNRNFIGIELNQDYIKLANKRLEPLIRQMKLL